MILPQRRAKFKQRAFPAYRSPLTAYVSSVASLLLSDRIQTALPALKSRNFRLFIIGQLISYTGTWLQTVAQGWLVLQLSNSAFIVGLVTALSALPILLFTLYGGVLADRVNRRTTVMVLQALLAVEALGLALLVVTHRVTVGWVMVLAGFGGLVTAFEVPVRQSMVAELSGRESLMNAIALQSSVFNLARVLGPAFAGVIIGIWGVAACFFLNAVSFLAVIWGLWRMDLPHRPPPPGGVDVIAAFKEGARYVRLERWPRALMILIASSTIFGFSFLAMLPVFARDVFGSDARGYGLLVSSVGVGALSGALFLAAFGGSLRKRRLALLSAGGFGLSLVATALAPNYWVAFGLLAVVGCSMVLQSISANTLLQQEAPDHLRGRVMGFYSFVVLGMAPFGALQIGWVSEHFGSRVAYALGGIACMLVAAGVARGVRREALARGQP
jgi:MFS family permease